MRTSVLVLFACAGLLLSGGTILIGTVVWNLLRMSYYFWTSDLGVELASSALFIAGGMLCLPTCWLATLVPHHNKSKSMNATLMGVTTVAMLLLSLGLSSMGALSRAIREPAMLNNSMQRAMAIDRYDPAVKNSFAAMQIELRCCGVQSFSDWHQYRRTLPPACCGRIWNGKHNDMCDTPLFSMGCLRPALTELRSYANTLSALASALVIVMAVTLFTAAYIQVFNEIERSKMNAFKHTTPIRIGFARMPLPTSPPPPHGPLIDSVMPPIVNAI